MKRKALLVCGILAFGGIFVASSGEAQCPEGKVEWTVVNPAGKVVVICVPEHVTGIGGPGDIAIPASCPCFSQEDIEAVLNKYPDVSCTYYEGKTSDTSELCSFVFCVDGVKFYAVEAPASAGGEKCVTKVFTDIRVNQCTTVPPTSSVDVGEEEADACVQVLKTFVASGDDCSDPVVVNPDPLVKPPMSFAFAGDTMSANDDYSFKDLGLRTPDVVFAVRPIPGLSQKPTVTISATPENWDLFLYVVTDCADIAGTYVAASDNTGPGGTETVEFGLYPETTYYVIVDGTTSQIDRGLYILNGAIEIK
jgi:hypothetical protein